MSTPTTVYQLDKPTVSGDADAWGGLLNTNLDDLDTFLARPRFKKNAPTVGATTPIDFSLANYFEFTVSQATSLVISNVPATLPDGTVPVTRGFLRITNGGAFAVTWPGSIVWPFETANAAPTGLAASGVDIIEIVTYDAGTTWYAILHHIKTDPNLWPRVSVYKTGNQSLVGLSTLSFDAERYDVGGMHDTVTNNSRLTVPANQGGLYTFTVSLNLNASIAGRVIVRKNGADLRTPESINSQQHEITLTEVLAAGDFIEFQFQNDGGGNTALSGILKTSAEMRRVR